MCENRERGGGVVGWRNLLGGRRGEDLSVERTERKGVVTICTGEMLTVPFSLCGFYVASIIVDAGFSSLFIFFFPL